MTPAPPTGSLAGSAPQVADPPPQPNGLAIPSIWMAEDGCLRLPSSSFYWALLDEGMLKGRSGRRKQQLDYLFESVLPLPVEQLQTAYLKVTNAQDRPRCLACGMDRERLKNVLDEAAIKPHAIVPSELPGFIRSEVGSLDPEPESLNLLTGDYEPAALKRARRGWRLQVAVLFILLCVVITLGLQRRARHAMDEVARFESLRRDLTQQALGAQGTLGGRQPAELQLTAELRRLRQTRQQPRAELALADVSHDLAGVLSHWPAAEDLFVQTESISVTPTAITIRAIAPNSADIQQLADSMIGLTGPANGEQTSLGGWELAQPQVNAARNAVQGTIQLRRVDTARAKSKELTKP